MCGRLAEHLLTTILCKFISNIRKNPTVGYMDAEIIIKTGRLYLRVLRQSDIDDILALNSDPDVRRFFPDGIQNREQTEARISDFLSFYKKSWVTMFCDI